MDLLDACSATTQFQFEDKFPQQKQGKTLGISLYLVGTNIIMEHFEEIALATADHKPAKWVKYVGDIFVVWSHGPAILQEFLHQLKILRPTSKFTMEVKVNNPLPSLDIFFIKKGHELTYYLLTYGAEHFLRSRQLCSS
jgi:hypothetical protein